MNLYYQGQAKNEDEEKYEARYNRLYETPSYKESKIESILRDESGKPIIFQKSTKIFPEEHEIYVRSFYKQNYAPGNIN